MIRKGKGRKEAVARETGKPARTGRAMRPAAQETASPAGLTKAERVLARLGSNFKRSEKPTRSRKQELKSARSRAVADLARVYLSNLAVGKNDPNVQYPRKQLIDTLNKSMRKPLPKTKRRTTTQRKPKEETPGDKSYRDWLTNMIDISRRKKKRQSGS